jgi:hypothetical protein
MINAIRITNHLGENLTIELGSPEKSGFFILNIDGLGPAKNVINTTDALSLNGTTINSSRSSYRNIVLRIGFIEILGMTIESLRQSTYRFFPSNKIIEVEVQTENRTGYIKCLVESNEPDIFSKMESTTISLLAPSSYFYDREIVDTTFTGFDNGFEFPFENPSLTESLIEFGQVYIQTTKNLYYEGDDPTGVIIYAKILGPVTGFAVHNTSTNKSILLSSDIIILLTGSGLIDGDLLVISTVKGSKSIYLYRATGHVYNIINALNPNSLWIELERGDNVFSYTANTGLNFIQLRVENDILYGGL